MIIIQIYSSSNIKDCNRLQVILSIDKGYVTCQLGLTVIHLCICMHSSAVDLKPYSQSVYIDV